MSLRKYLLLGALLAPIIVCTGCPLLFLLLGLGGGGTGGGVFINTTTSILVLTARETTAPAVGDVFSV